VQKEKEENLHGQIYSIINLADQMYLWPQI